MLSLMTVVLPQHSESSGSAKARLGNRNKSCECPCRTENMTKNNLPQRCPYLKGYMAEPRRLQDSVPEAPRVHHQHQLMHPVTSREWESLREAACYWKDKYDRLYESQRRLQKVNEGLEEKLLKVAEKFENEKSDLTRDVSDLTSRLVEARLAIAELEEENEQYRNDCSIAVRLLQCKPSNFVAHKFNSLPADFQTKVKRHLNQQNIRRSASAGNARPPSVNSSIASLLEQCPPDVRTIKVSVPTLPPAAMVYSVNQGERSHQTNISSAPSTSSSMTSSSSDEVTPDHVSAAIIAKVLEERSRERKTASCSNKQNRTDTNDKGCHVLDSATQTTMWNIYDTLCSSCQKRLINDRSPSTTSSESANFALVSRQRQSSSTETAI